MPSNLSIWPALEPIRSARVAFGAARRGIVVGAGCARAIAVVGDNVGNVVCVGFETWVSVCASEHPASSRLLATKSFRRSNTDQAVRIKAPSSSVMTAPLKTVIPESVLWRLLPMNSDISEYLAALFYF